MCQKKVKNENYYGVFEMRDLARFFSEVLIVDKTVDFKEFSSDEGMVRAEKTNRVLGFLNLSQSLVFSCE